MKKLLIVLALVVLSCSTAFAWPTWTGTAVLTQATDNNTTAAVSVPRDCKSNVSLHLPTIDSSTVAVHVSEDGTTYLPLWYNDGAAAAPAAWLIGAGTGGFAFEIPRTALTYKYMRFEFGTAQTANRTLTVTCN